MSEPEDSGQDADIMARGVRGGKGFLTSPALSESGLKLKSRVFREKG